MADDSLPSPVLDDALLTSLLERARRNGATDAVVHGSATRALNVSVRDGNLQMVERAEGARIKLTVFLGARTATQATSHIGPASLDQLVDDATAAAQAGAEDPYAGLADDWLTTSGDDRHLELYDPDIPDAEALRTWALEAEETGRAVPGVAISEGGSAGWELNHWTQISSRGVRRCGTRSGFAVGAAMIAANDRSREFAGEHSQGVWRDQLRPSHAIGLEAGRKAVGRLGARKPRSCTAPVIFDRTTAFTLLDPFFQALSGAAVFRKQSFLIGRLGQQIFSDRINAIDDPHLLRGRGSAAVDGDAVTPRLRHLISAGRFDSWVVGVYAARQLGLTSTGHANGLYNLTIQAGDRGQAALMRDAGKGLLVTSVFSPSLNPHTSDWSIGVGGFWFENGEIQYPVSELTVAGNLLALYRTLVPGADLEIRDKANSPSLLVDGMMIAGT